MTLASNEQVPERRGGQGDPARQPGRLDPLAAGRFSGCRQLLSVLKLPVPFGGALPPRERLNPSRSLLVTAGEWAAHRGPASAPAALDSGLPWKACADRVVEPHPIDAARCRPRRFFRARGSTGWKRLDSSHMRSSSAVPAAICSAVSNRY